MSSLTPVHIFPRKTVGQLTSLRLLTCFASGGTYRDPGKQLDRLILEAIKTRRMVADYEKESSGRM